MEKQNFKELVQELNYKSLRFISISNKEKNSYYNLFSISFKIVKMEMYLGEFLVMTNLLKISIKHLESKNKNHIIIDIENPKSTDELLNWKILDDVRIEILKSIEKYSDKVVYSKELKCLM